MHNHATRTFSLLALSVAMGVLTVVVLPLSALMLETNFGSNNAPDPEPLAAPSNMGASITTPTSIHWTWQDNSNNETGFELFETDNAPTPAVIADADATGVTEGNLAENTQYQRYLRAVNGGQSSAIIDDQPSATASTTIHDPAIGDFSLRTEAGSPDTVWISVVQPTNPTEGETSWLLERSTDPNFPAGETTVVRDWSQDYTEVEDSGLTPGTTYHWVVRFRDLLGRLTSYSPKQSETP